MITVKEKVRLIEACFGKAKIANDNKNVVVYCPVCKSKGEDKLKLAIGINKGMYHCWVCETKGKNIEYDDDTVDVYIVNPKGEETLIDITTVKPNKKELWLLFDKELKTELKSLGRLTHAP